MPHFAHPITCIKPTLKAVRDGMRWYIVVGIGFNTVEHKCSMIVVKGPKATGRPSSASLQGKPQFWIAALLGPFGCSAFGEKFTQSIFVSESLTCSENNQSSYFLKFFSSAYNMCCIMENIRFLATILVVLLRFVTSVPRVLIS